MKEIFQLCDFYGIKDEAANIFCAATKIEEYGKCDSLFRTGDRVNYVYILLDGVVRGYNVTKDGQDVTEYITHDYGQILGGAPVINENVAIVSAEALTPCRIALIPCSEFVREFRLSMDVLGIYERHFYGEYVRSLRHKAVLQSHSAKEKYEWFLEEYPGLIDLIPHTHIASFLNVTPVTLSRIRRSLIHQD